MCQALYIPYSYFLLQPCKEISLRLAEVGSEPDLIIKPRL